jgi:hypothetical protein
MLHVVTAFVRTTFESRACLYQQRYPCFSVYLTIFPELHRSWVCKLQPAENRTQGQQSFIKIAKSTVEVHSVLHDICIPTETGGQVRAVVYYSVRLRKSDRERGRDLRRDAQIL